MQPVSGYLVLLAIAAAIYVVTAVFAGALAFFAIPLLRPWCWIFRRCAGL